MKTGIELIAEERQKQINKHGYDLNHDKQHSDGELLKAAESYMIPGNIWSALDQKLVNAYRREIDDDEAEELEKIWFPQAWPFKPEEWHGQNDDRITQLKKAGAFIAAEIDRLNY